MQSGPSSISDTRTPSPAKVTSSMEMAVIPTPCLGQQCMFETCSQQRISSYDYCSRHILLDSSAPYKQCNYVFNSTGKRCFLTAPKLDKREGYCVEHSRKQLAMRMRASRQKVPNETADTLLHNLGHYIPPQTGRTINPFKEVNASEVNNSVSKVLEYASDSESEIEGGAVTLDAAWSGDSESEGDSPDSDMEDPLRHAGVYTDEEVVTQAREGLKRLQALYIREFRSLQFRLREQRRHFLMAQKREKETLMSVHQQPKITAEEMVAYKKLQALNRYRKPQGAEAVLHKKAKDRKAQAMMQTTTNRQGHASRCSFMEGGVKCDDKALPMSKLCLRHILNDSQQLLFKPCAVSKTDLPPCQEPVLSVFPGSSCQCHRDFPDEPKKEPIESILNLIPNDVSIATVDNKVIEDMDIDVPQAPLTEKIQVTKKKEETGLSEPSVSESRRRKQDLKDIVTELPQDSDNESATISASESLNSDFILM